MSARPTQIDANATPPVCQNKLPSDLSSFELPRCFRISDEYLDRFTEGYKTFTFSTHFPNRTHNGIMVGVSASRLVETFIEMIRLLPDKVDIYLQSKHHHPRYAPVEYFQSNVPRLFVETQCARRREMLISDGHAGLSVTAPGSSPSRCAEVQLFPNKVLYVYGTEFTKSVGELLRGMGIVKKDQIVFAADYNTNHPPFADREHIESFLKFARVFGAERLDKLHLSLKGS